MHLPVVRTGNQLATHNLRVPSGFPGGPQHGRACFFLRSTQTDVPRQANFVLGTPASLIVRVKGTVPKGWEQVVKLRAGRDAKLHRYDITGTHSPGWNSWLFPLVPRSESYHIVVVHRPRYEVTDDPKENRKRRLASRDEEIQSISPPIRLVDTVRYDVEAQLSEGQEPKMRLVTISAIKDILGNDRTDELSAPAPLFEAPVDEATQRTGFELLDRIARVAAPWNASPSESIAGYQYDYVEVGEGRAPEKLRIEAGGFDLRMHFKVHDEILWLLDRARHGSQTDPCYHIENVKVQRS